LLFDSGSLPDREAHDRGHFFTMMTAAATRVWNTTEAGFYLTIANEVPAPGSSRTFTTLYRWDRLHPAPTN
jgi:hypothetical protein